jgi:hypothetical protein
MSDETSLQQEIERLRAAVFEHYSQRADDRCFLDDDKLYAAFGLPSVDRRVGDKLAMLENCARYIERRCEGGYWPSYVALEDEIKGVHEVLDACQVERGTDDARISLAKRIELLLKEAGLEVLG